MGIGSAARPGAWGFHQLFLTPTHGGSPSPDKHDNDNNDNNKLMSMIAFPPQECVWDKAKCETLVHRDGHVISVPTVRQLDYGLRVKGVGFGLGLRWMWIRD